MSNKNVFIAATNLVCVFPLYEAKHDVCTFAMIFLAATMSIVSHLFESHKHGMIGFGCSHKTSFWLNRLDVFGAWFLAVRVFMISEWLVLFKFAPWVMLFTSCNIVSERHHTIATQRVFLVWHTMWHLGIFTVLGFILFESKK